MRARTAKKNLNEQWTYALPPFNKGKQTIDDMSLIVGMYGNHIVTKTGYLVGIIETSGINVDLLSFDEQTDVFDSYNTFLISVTGSQPEEEIQFVELTIPVNMDEYIFGLKLKYVEEINAPEPNTARINLIASYIEAYTKLQFEKNMTTKKHLVIVRNKIKSRHAEDLEISKTLLSEKMESLIHNFESSFIDSDMTADTLTTAEVLEILKTFINFKS